MKIVHAANDGLVSLKEVTHGARYPERTFEFDGHTYCAVSNLGSSFHTLDCDTKMGWPVMNLKSRTVRVLAWGTMVRPVDVTVHVKEIA